MCGVGVLLLHLLSHSLVRGQVSFFVSLKQERRLMDEPVAPSREYVSSMWHRRDRTAVCHVLLSQQACIRPCTPCERRRCVSKQRFCSHHPQKGQFAEEWRGWIETSVVPNLFAGICSWLHCRYIFKAGSQWVLVQMLSSVVGWIYSSYCFLFINEWLPLFILRTFERMPLILPYLSSTRAHLLQSFCHLWGNLLT